MVLFVERWAAVREPTVAAQQALAAAYLHLRLLDRAFSRVEALADAREATPAMFALGVTILRLRGWPDDAQRFAQRAVERFPDEPSVSDLMATAREPWPHPSPDPADPVAVAVAEAEQAMVGGHFVRAQVELQRFRREHSKRNTRVDELLWAIRGDFAMDVGLEHLVPLLLPRTDASDTLVPVEDSEIGGAASTEAFRQLFRNLDMDDDGPDDPALEEATHITEMAGLAQSAQQGDPGPSDTQIMRVVRRGRDDADAIETVLANTLSDLGVSDYARPDHLEDDSIVVVTRRDERGPPITEPMKVGKAKVQRDARREAAAHQQLTRGTPIDDFLEPPKPTTVSWLTQVTDRLREEGRNAAFWAGGAAMLAVFGLVLLIAAIGLSLSAQ